MDKGIIKHIVEKVRGAIGPVEHVEPVTGGYSPDRKYSLWRGGEPKYLMRLSAISERQRRENEFHWIGEHYSKGVLCPAAVAFGVIEEESVVYYVLDYLPGEAASEVLPRLSCEQQHEIGTIAGRELRKIHNVEGGETSVEWRERLRCKYQRYADVMRREGLRYEGQETVERYVEQRGHLLEGQPVQFQHDDFHPGNLFVRDGRFGGVIDFNRFDWGDPWQDFYKVAFFTAPLSPEFARGQVVGYFAGPPPASFWPLYNLYVGMAISFTLGWAAGDPDRPIAWAKEHAGVIVRTHDFLGGGPPEWFRTV